MYRINTCMANIYLTHWGRETHICVGNLTIIGSDNGLSPGRRQAIIGTNVGILLIGTWGTNFSEILIEMYIFSLKKMHLKVSSGKWRPFCLDLNVLTLFFLGISATVIHPPHPQGYSILFHYWNRWIMINHYMHTFFNHQRETAMTKLCAKFMLHSVLLCFIIHQFYHILQDSIKHMFGLHIT